MDTLVRPNRFSRAETRISTPPMITPAEMQEVRESYGMTRLEFSRVFGLSEDQIYRWEKSLCVPTGTACRIFHLIRTHGLDYVLD